MFGSNRLEDALRDSETRYRRHFETAKDGILLLDSVSGQITDANPFLIELLGYTHEELSGKKLWEIDSFKDAVTSQAAFQELQQKKYIRYEKLPLETKNGGRVEVEFVLVLFDSPLESSRQHLEMICGYVRELPIRHGEQLLGTITLSAGLTQAPENGLSAKDFLRATDEALYVAKCAGRDRIVAYRDLGKVRSSSIADKIPFKKEL